MKIEEKIDKYLNESNMMKVFAVVESLKKIAKNKTVSYKDVEQAIISAGLHPDDDWPDVQATLEDEGITIK